MSENDTFTGSYIKMSVIAECTFFLSVRHNHFHLILSLFCILYINQNLKLQNFTIFGNIQIKKRLLNHAVMLMTEAVSNLLSNVSNFIR